MSLKHKDLGCALPVAYLICRWVYPVECRSDQNEIKEEVRD
jgi:hypothetical protein